MVNGFETATVELKLPDVDPLDTTGAHPLHQRRVLFNKSSYAGMTASRNPVTIRVM